MSSQNLKETQIKLSCRKLVNLSGNAITKSVNYTTRILEIVKKYSFLTLVHTAPYPQQWKFMKRIAAKYTSKRHVCEYKIKSCT